MALTPPPSPPPLSDLVVTVYADADCSGAQRALGASDFVGGRHDHGWDACNGEWDDGTPMAYQGERATWWGSFRVAAGWTVSAGASCHDDFDYGDVSLVQVDVAAAAGCVSPSYDFNFVSLLGGAPPSPPVPPEAAPDAEARCAEECRALGFCCADHAVGANQYLSCAQACMIVARGSSAGECAAACDEERGCSRTVNGYTYGMCGSCDDLDLDGDGTLECAHGVQSTDACHAGCGIADGGAEPTLGLSTPEPECTPDPSPLCSFQYAPVCGSDGVTYSNICVAAANCQHDATTGACADEAPPPSPAPLPPASSPPPSPPHAPPRTSCTTAAQCNWPEEYCHCDAPYSEPVNACAVGECRPTDPSGELALVVAQRGGGCDAEGKIWWRHSYVSNVDFAADETLDADFDTSAPQLCVRAAAMEPRCGDAVQWSPAYSWEWGCFCCAPGAATMADNDNWNVVAFAASVRAGCVQVTLSTSYGEFSTEASWLLDGVMTSVAECGDGGSCEQVVCLKQGAHTLELFDSYGDGWNGAVVQVAAEGAQLLELSLDGGSYAAHDFTVGGNSPSVPPRPSPFSPDPSLPPPPPPLSDLVVTVYADADCSGAQRALGASDFVGGRHDHGWDACNGEWDDGTPMAYQGERATWWGSFRVAAGWTVSAGASCHDDFDYGDVSLVQVDVAAAAGCVSPSYDFNFVSLLGGAPPSPPVPPEAAPDAEARCAEECRALGFCCADHAVGANQYLSCAQACMIVARGSSAGECAAACDEERGCSRTVNGYTYGMCGSCDDLDLDGDGTLECAHGVQSTDACHAGCGIADGGAEPTTPPPPAPPPPQLVALASPPAAPLSPSASVRSAPALPIDESRTALTAGGREEDGDAKHKLGVPLVAGGGAALLVGLLALGAAFVLWRRARKAPRFPGAITASAPVSNAVVASVVELPQLDLPPLVASGGIVRDVPAVPAGPVTDLRGLPAYARFVSERSSCSSVYDASPVGPSDVAVVSPEKLPLPSDTAYPAEPEPGARGKVAEHVSA